MIIMDIAIRSGSPGPVFGREACIGRRGWRFQMLQFRKTVAHEPDKPVWAAKPELTRLGAFLRYTRVDGLPQLLNVLPGR